MATAMTRVTPVLSQGLFSFHSTCNALQYTTLALLLCSQIRILTLFLDQCEVSDHLLIELKGFISPNSTPTPIDL